MDSKENLISIKLTTKRNKTILTICEILDAMRPSNIIVTSDPSLDSVVNWATEKLETWPTAKRIAWNMWEFTSRKEAEKLITLYHLVWAK